MNRHWLAAKTALRYLFARKSHSAINIISIVSVCGVAIATMAMICVMSVYNGFQDFLGDRVKSLLPDVEVKAKSEKLIANADSVANLLSKMKEVGVASSVVDDNMMVWHGNSMIPVRVLGVDPVAFAEITDVKSILSPGGTYSVGFPATDSAEPAEAGSSNGDSNEIDAVASEEFDESELFASAAELYSGDEEMTNAAADQTEIPDVIVSSDLMTQLYGPAGVDEELLKNNPVSLLVPRRTAYISTVDPSRSFLTNSVNVSASLPADKTNMNNFIIAGLPMARNMLEYTTEANSIYIKAANGISISQLAEAVQDKLGEGYTVTDRNSQLSVHFNMMRIEKWVTFLLLAFILLIASFNIISTLSMLIVDKRRSIQTMRNLGASKGLIGEVFCWESFFVCVAGTVIGLGIGLGLCYLQIHYGFITIPNSTNTLIIDRYPVAVRWTDVAWLMLPSMLIAFITAVISSGFARRSASLNN